MTKRIGILSLICLLTLGGLIGPALQRAQAAGPRWQRPAANQYEGQNGQPTLPRGRRYYNNRYFGDFNNRYYGPQYGYF